MKTINCDHRYVRTLVSKLDDQEIAAVAAYYQQLRPSSPVAAAARPQR